MKITVKIISALIALIMMLGMLASCSSSDVVMTIGDREIKRDRYTATAKSIKSQFLTSNDLEESDELWTQYVDSTYTANTQQYLDSMIQTYIITYTLYSIHFDELGLTLDDDAKKAVEETMQTMIDQAGSREALEETLTAQGFTYEEFENQYYDEAKKDAVIMHYFGPDSKENPVSLTDLKAYYDEYYTKVKHVFLSTKKNGDDMSVPEKEKVGIRANDIYAKAMGGEDFDKLINEYGEDPGMTTNPDGYVFSTEDTSYTRIFHNTAFDMEEGEIRLIQSNLGYHIMKRCSFTDDDINNDVVALIENMMSTESADLLEDLKESIGVEYNNALLDELSVVNLETAPTDENTTSAAADQIKEQLGLDKKEN